MDKESVKVTIEGTTFNFSDSENQIVFERIQLVLSKRKVSKIKSRHFHLSIGLLTD